MGGDLSKSNDIVRPHLPEGLTWVNPLVGSKPYEVEDIRASVSAFGVGVAKEIDLLLQSVEKVIILVPISGGLVATNAVLTALNSLNIPSSKLEIVFATHLSGSEEYSLSKSLSEKYPIFIIDDIYDSGKSFREIVKLVLKASSEESKQISGRYLSTKIGVNLPANCVTNLTTVLPNQWMVSPFGMNSGINGIDSNGNIVNNYLFENRFIIEVLERLYGVPIAVTNMEKVLEWDKTQVTKYITILKADDCKFYLNSNENSIMFSIFSKIYRIKSTTDTPSILLDLFSYLNEKVLVQILIMNGFNQKS